MSRKLKNIILPKRILILCEGESEKIYLKGIKKEKHNRNCSIEIEIYQPNDYSPLGLVNEAIKKVHEAKKEYPYYCVWVVFDKDSHKGIEKAFNLVNQNKANIKIAFSNICYEYWILLHFEPKKRSFKDSKQLIDYIEKKYNFEYSKTMNIYEFLKKKIDKALINTKWLHELNKPDLDSGIKPYKLAAYTNFDKLYIYLCEILK